MEWERLYQFPSRRGPSWLSMSHWTCQSLAASESACSPISSGSSTANNARCLSLWLLKSARWCGKQVMVSLSVICSTPCETSNHHGITHGASPLPDHCGQVSREWIQTHTMIGLCSPGAYTLAGKKIQRTSRQGKNSSGSISSYRAFLKQNQKCVHPLAIPAQGSMKSVLSMREGLTEDSFQDCRPWLGILESSIPRVFVDRVSLMSRTQNVNSREKGIQKRGRNRDQGRRHSQGNIWEDLKGHDDITASGKRWRSKKA